MWKLGTLKNFIEKAKKLHGDKYDYSLVHYKGYRVKVKIICPEHGVFEQLASNHLLNFGCKLCGNKLATEKSSQTVKSKRPDFSHIIPPEGAKVVPLTRGQYALVDEEDYERVMEHSWSARQSKQGNYYATGSINGKHIALHRFIMQVTDTHLHVDHIFHNTLDNRKSQLRICTQQQNAMNQNMQKGCTSQFKGVIYRKDSNKWRSSITFEGRKYNLGCYQDEEEAARAYDAKAKELFGEFAYLNFKIQFT